MKPYNELSPRGRVLRLRQAARTALDAYGLSDAPIRFNHDTGNASFRVTLPNSGSRTASDDLFVDRQLLLRLNQPGYQSTALIESELAWLEALRADAAMPVPQPVRALDGSLVVEVPVPGSGQSRQCSLLRWVRGRMQEERIGPAQLRATGRIMARLHSHASRWDPPPGFCRWRYDWDGFLGDANPTGTSSKEACRHIVPLLRPLYDETAAELKDVMADLGTESGAFGLVHADIAFGDNILFWRGEARPIDFGDCAFAHWMYDIGVALSSVRRRDDWPALRDSFLEGYREVRNLPEVQWQHLDLFVAAWHAYEILWAGAMIEQHPQNTAGNLSWMKQAGESLRAVRAQPRG
ncbi:MAG: phosphotransferase [Candidatus Bipolaricaulis sp.]|nr:phosphotransferase [Candidatus Bipolaricaulis sp.]